MTITIGAQVCGDCDLPHFLRFGPLRHRDAVASRAKAVRSCPPGHSSNAAPTSAVVGQGRLTRLHRVRSGELLATLHQLDEEEDINKVLKYFSYEHFYVIYCKVSRS